MGSFLPESLWKAGTLRETTCTSSRSTTMIAPECVRIEMVAALSAVFESECNSPRITPPCFKVMESAPAVAQQPSPMESDKTKTGREGSDMIYCFSASDSTYADKLYARRGCR